ncbi:ROK family protein [Ktedonobacter robiniae]|nr:ROK family protein [Ktedonobacter robiniae]
MQRAEQTTGAHIEEDNLVVGVDVGGTKIAAGVVNAQGQVSGRIKLPTDTSSVEHTLQAIALSIRSAIQAAHVPSQRIKAVGLGIPGIVDPAQGVCQLSVNLGWQHVAVKAWLERELQLPCFIENDVSVAALGEGLYGVGKGQENAVYLSLGTGIAARAIIHGRLYRGAHGMAGEIGHTVFAPSGPLCRCGARGCLEALAAGPALARNAEDKLQRGESSLLEGIMQEQAVADLRAEHVFEAAARDDALAGQILREAGQHLAYSIYLLAMIFDPQMVVIGGGLAVEGSPLIGATRTGLTHWMKQAPVFREMLSQDAVRLASLQGDAGIVGAAALAIAEARTRSFL